VLKGGAKTKYMREYMRRKRAGQGKSKSGTGDKFGLRIDPNDTVVLRLRIAELERHVKRLQTLLSKKPKQAVQGDAELQRQITELRQKLRQTQARYVWPKPTAVKSVHAYIPTACPDPAVKRQYEEASKLFNALPIRDIDLEE
jgi:hypothetical protein